MTGFPVAAARSNRITNVSLPPMAGPYTLVSRTEHAAIPAKWYFSQKDQTLLGYEVTVDKEEDPCEVFLADYRMVDGRLLPHRVEVRRPGGT